MDGENPGPSDGPPRGSRTTRFEWSLDGEDAGGARPARSLLALSGGPAPVRRRREDAPLDRADSGVHRLTIRDVATQDQHGDQILFDPLGSALSLRVACEVSPSVAALPAAYFTADFLILDPSTSRIVVHKRWCGRLEWGVVLALDGQSLGARRIRHADRLGAPPRVTRSEQGVRLPGGDDRGGLARRARRAVALQLRAVTDRVVPGGRRLAFAEPLGPRQALGGRQSSVDHEREQGGRDGAR